MDEKKLIDRVEKAAEKGAWEGSGGKRLHYMNIAIIVLLILNPLSSRRSLTDPQAAKRAIRKIKKG